MRLRSIGENGATQLPALFSRISNGAPVLCLQLSSTPRLFTLCDQAPGSTSLPSFVSDAAVFPGPLLPALTPSAPLREGLTQRWPLKRRPNVAAPRNARWTLLLPVPRDCGQVPPVPENVREIV